MTADELKDYLKCADFDEAKSLDALDFIDAQATEYAQAAQTIESLTAENAELKERNMRLFLKIADGEETADAPEEDAEEKEVENFISEILGEE